MAKKTIVTIGRQFGSGGKEIGVAIAKKRGIKFYDKELLKRAAQESGLCETLFESMDERPKSLLYSLVMDPYAVSAMSTAPYNTMEQDVYKAVFETVRTVAEESSCVIVGRCADYALRDRDDVLRVFIYAPDKDRIRRVSRRHGMTEQKARDFIRKIDKQRSSYYSYYSDNRWGERAAYDLLIDATVLGVDGTAQLICDMMDRSE